MATDAKCVIKTCKNSAWVRGLCPSCYKRMRELVAKKETTWAKLEADGLAKPRKVSKVKAAIRAVQSKSRRSPSKRPRQKAAKP